MKSKYKVKRTYLTQHSSPYCWEGFLMYIDKKLQVPREVNFHPNIAFFEFLGRVKGNYYYLYTHNKWEQQFIEPLRENPYYEHKK